jgi:hypothetical protein
MASAKNVINGGAMPAGGWFALLEGRIYCLHRRHLHGITNLLFLMVHNILLCNRVLTLSQQPCVMLTLNIFPDYSILQFLPDDSTARTPQVTLTERIICIERLILTLLLLCRSRRGVQQKRSIWEFSVTIFKTGK